MAMLIVDFFTWWYTEGWLKTIEDLKRRISSISEMFSVSILLKTIFNPWRRIITYPGQNLKTRLTAMIDNLISRIMGFMVRLLTLIAALVIFVVVSLISLASIVIWPLLPLIFILILIKGLVG